MAHRVNLKQTMTRARGRHGGIARRRAFLGSLATMMKRGGRVRKARTRRRT